MSEAMNFLRVSILAVLTSCAWMTSAQAEQIELPTLTLMAEPELRQETGIVPFQQDPKALKALQHIVMRSQWDAQNFVVDSQQVTNLNEEARSPEPDMSQLSPLMQMHVMAIANGLQSADPTEGLYIMLKPLGIDRNNINDIRQHGLQMNLNSQFGNGLQQSPQAKPPRMQ